MHDRRLAKLQLMVVDNDQTIRNLLYRVLVNLGFSNILLAEDGFEAIKLMRTRKVDLILTDWELRPQSLTEALPANSVIASEWGEFPPHNGASFVQCLRHSRFSPDPFVPVIMLTSPTQANHIRYARDAGVSEIIVKPIIADELCKRIIEIAERPRPFVTSGKYKGPCRRRKQTPMIGRHERRLREIRVISFEEAQKGIRHG